MRSDAQRRVLPFQLIGLDLLGTVRYGIMHTATQNMYFNSQSEPSCGMVSNVHAAILKMHEGGKSHDYILGWLAGQGYYRHTT